MNPPRCPLCGGPEDLCRQGIHMQMSTKRTRRPDVKTSSATRAALISRRVMRTPKDGPDNIAITVIAQKPTVK